jgi:chromosome segregation ATPase
MADDVENHTLRLLQEIRTEMAGLREDFARFDQRLTAVEQRLDGVEQHLDGIEQRLGGVEQRLTGSEQRLGGLEGTVSKVIDAVTSMATVQEQHSAMLAELVETSRISGGRLNTVEARVGRIEKQAGMTLA